MSYDACLLYPAPIRRLLVRETASRVESLAAPFDLGGEVDSALPFATAFVDVPPFDLTDRADVWRSLSSKNETSARGSAFEAFGTATTFSFAFVDRAAETVEPDLVLVVLVDLAVVELAFDPDFDEIELFTDFVAFDAVELTVDLALFTSFVTLFCTDVISALTLAISLSTVLLRSRTLTPVSRSNSPVRSCVIFRRSRSARAA
jgi:hypothetical protein